jgi:hypothetical protein
VAIRHAKAVQQLSRAPRRSESCPSMIGPISLGVKQMGARSAGNPHAACDVAGARNVARPKYWDTRRRKGETTGNPNLGLNRRASPRPYRCAGCGTGATAALVRRRQTKGAATDRPSLTPPRHISPLHKRDSRQITMRSSSSRVLISPPSWCVQRPSSPRARSSGALET